MSSDQFAALVDVIGSIFLAQIPDHPPRPAMKATALLAVEGRSLVEGEERASAAVVAGPLAAFRVARWAATCAVVDASLAEVFAETQEKCVGPGLGSRSKSGGSKSVPFDGEACARVSRRLARRVEDAERASTKRSHPRRRSSGPRGGAPRSSCHCPWISFDGRCGSRAERF